MGFNSGFKGLSCSERRRESPDLQFYSLKQGAQDDSSHSSNLSTVLYFVCMILRNCA